MSCNNYLSFFCLQRLLRRRVLVWRLTIRCRSQIAELTPQILIVWNHCACDVKQLSRWYKRILGEANHDREYWRTRAQWEGLFITSEVDVPRREQQEDNGSMKLVRIIEKHRQITCLVKISNVATVPKDNKQNNMSTIFSVFAKLFWKTRLKSDSIPRTVHFTSIVVI